MYFKFISSILVLVLYCTVILAGDLNSTEDNATNLKSVPPEFLQIDHTIQENLKSKFQLRESLVNISKDISYNDPQDVIVLWLNSSIYELIDLVDHRIKTLPEFIGIARLIGQLENSSLVANAFKNYGYSLKLIPHQKSQAITDLKKVIKRALTLSSSNRNFIYTKLIKIFHDEMIPLFENAKLNVEVAKAKINDLLDMKKAISERDSLRINNIMLSISIDYGGVWKKIGDDILDLEEKK